MEQRRSTPSPATGEPIFQAMLDAAPDAMIGVNSDGIIVMANAQTEVVFGYEPHRLLGEPIEVLVPDDARDLHPSHRSEYFREPRTRPMGAGLELSGRRADGTEFPAEISLSSIQTERAPSRSPRSGTSRTGSRHRRTPARRGRRRIARTRRRVISSHASVTSFGRRSTRSSGSRSCSRWKGFRKDNIRSVLQILEAGGHLLDLINEILEIEKIASGRMTLSLEPVHVGLVLDEALKLVRPIADQDGVRLINPPAEFEISVQADRQRLKQVFLNLLSNAVKFNRAGGGVRISGEVTSEGSFRVTVTDTGHGIAPEMMGDLFTPFSRLGAERRGIEGTGLGLSLSKSLVQTMAGSIEAESVLGEGSSFRIELPIAESAEVEDDEAPSAAPPDMGAVGSKTILYIEDNLANLQLIEGILAYRPAVVVLSAMQGSIGMELARRHQPDLILLDLHLPDMSGEEVLERLQGNEATSGIPIVVVSADASAETLGRLREAGASSFITKPLNVGHFLETIDGMLGRS